MIDWNELTQKADNALRFKHNAREQALPKSRTAIRFAANAIRAAHRHDFQSAGDLVQKCGTLIQEMADDLKDHHDILFAGFVQDAQKEYSEAAITCALVQEQPLPTPEDLQVDWAPYLNGMGEAVGELRRYLLDKMRHRNLEGCEKLLEYMDTIYGLLTSLDFPDAITSGLRRTTDSTRGILEKTRGDLTLAVSQQSLEQHMKDLAKDLQRT